MRRIKLSTSTNTRRKRCCKDFAILVEADVADYTFPEPPYALHNATPINFSHAIPNNHNSIKLLQHHSRDFQDGQLQGTMGLRSGLKEKVQRADRGHREGNSL